MLSLMREKLAVPESLHRLMHSERGSVLMEVALTLPLLFTLFGGCFEMSRYALLEMKVSRAATTLADIVAQNSTSVTSTQIDGFVLAIPHIGSPFTMDNTNTQIIISAVKADASNVAKVCWQVSEMGSLGESSSVGVHNATAVLPDNIVLQEGDTAIIAEVFYDYSPTVFSSFVDPKIISNISVYRPRLATLETLMPSGTTCS
jgi:hypothetical protein